MPRYSRIRSSGQRHFRACTLLHSAKAAPSNWFYSLSLRLAIEKVQADRGFVILRNEQGELIPRHTKLRRGELKFKFELKFKLSAFAWTRWLSLVANAEI